MRVPHTIPPNTLKAHETSEATLGLAGERERRLRAEDWSWGENLQPTLAEECVRFLVSEFDDHKRVLPFLEEESLILLLETLPTTLPLEIVIPLIPDGIYWKRRCEETWSTLNDVARYGGWWKRMFVERYIQDLIEKQEPGYTDWTDLGNTLKLCSPFITRLEITQMQPPRSMEAPPSGTDLCNTEEFIPEHLDLSPVLSTLVNLEELNIQFGVKNIGMNFTFKCFRLHNKDVDKLGKGLNKSKQLKTLRIFCSDIDDKKLNVILKSLEHSDQFQELEIAHCKITDVGAKALGHFITTKSSMRHLKLQNNFIKTEGAQGIAYSLTKEGRADLETLDLKFNLIGEEGGRYIATALAKSVYPRRVVLAGCGLEETAGRDLVNMLTINQTLAALDLTNNALGPEVGQLMVQALVNNHTLLRLDVRNCGFGEECERRVHRLTFRNREEVRKMKESEQSFLGSTERRPTPCYVPDILCDV